MHKYMRIIEFAKELFSSEKEIKTASEIIQGMLNGKSPRISDVADAMPGGYAQ